MELEEEERRIIVAPIISDQKRTQLIGRIAQTLLGVSTAIGESPLGVVWAIVMPIVTFLIPLLVENDPVGYVIPLLINIVGTLVVDCLRKSGSLGVGHMICKLVTVGLFSLLWGHHVYVLARHHSGQVGLFILSAVSIITSLLTVGLEGVREFSGNGLDNQTIGCSSTLYMRFFIAFPLLISEFIIYQVEENYGSSHLYVLRVCTSLIWLIWWLGWLGSLQNTLYFLFNSIGIVVFGNQTQPSLGAAIAGSLIGVVPIGVYNITFQRQDQVILQSLIIGATASSIFTFIRYNRTYPDLTPNVTYTKAIILIIVQIVICIILVIFDSVEPFGRGSLPPLLAIDFVLYLTFWLLKELARSWARFGCNCGISCLNQTVIRQVERIVLRITAALCFIVILNEYQPDYLDRFGYDSRISNYIIIPFLAYRSFKRCLTHTTSLSLHGSLFIGLIAFAAGREGGGTLLALIMPPLPANPYHAIVSIFTIPPKAIHKNECCYQIIYALLTFVGLVMYIGTLGLMQLTMFFGLPIYYPVLPTQAEAEQTKSAQSSLYAKIVAGIDRSLFRLYDAGFYLLRVDKYILLLHVKSNCFGFGQLLQLRGLQVQQVTSCHSKEGETIDRLVEETWGPNHQSCTTAPCTTAITPYAQHTINVPTQNDIQLTGIIEAPEFLALYKQAVLKSITREYSKITLNETQIRQADLICSEMNAFYKKDTAEGLFPHEFANECGVRGAYPIMTGKPKLPPIAKKGQKKKEMVDDFMDLLGDSGGPAAFETSNSALTNPVDKQKQEQKPVGPKIEECNMGVILTLYYYSVGKQDYLNTDKLYRIIKKDKDAVTQVDFQQSELILSRALGAAFKISVDKYIEGQTEVTMADFTEYDNNCFLGTSDSEEYAEAVAANKTDIWSIAYIKKQLSIRRMALHETEMYVFQADEVIVRSVWANLRFELLYATNDDDERYSIQTHPTLLRNLWVEACEQPYGYPSYCSGTVISP